MPIINDKKLKETSVAVGYFVKNLPVTPSKRKRGQSFQTNPHRMAEADAYLNVSFEANSQGKDCKTCWKDEGGLTVSSEFVRFKDGMSRAQAVELAIVNWDKCERAQVDKYNSEFIIALARMHTVRFAKDGTSHPLYIPHELQVNSRTLKCKLISDEFEAYKGMINTISQRLQKTKLGRPNLAVM
ncbi:hypothetical protein FACUT_9936 [Fusarium acutatum]|uniref:Uncharacterized protein n=1 Tax=Fusarium acutatum TaxID=78861 RepID=A0A8H4NM94_9HYPO|nr:hypothetical protein FACUT_9936 [Fusarium acutatum]